MHTQDYQSVLKSLPENDLPSFFGLPANIERSSQRTISSQVISQLKVLARIEGSGERFDREAWAADLSPLLSLWKRLNQARENYMYVFMPCSCLQTVKKHMSRITCGRDVIKISVPEVSFNTFTGAPSQNNPLQFYYSSELRLLLNNCQTCGHI